MQNKNILVNLLKNKTNTLNQPKSVSVVTIPLPNTDEIKNLIAQLKTNLSSEARANANKQISEFRTKNKQMLPGAISIASYIPEIMISEYQGKESVLIQQAKKLDEYLNHSDIYAAVKQSYVSKSYKSFSPETGDANCQSRVFLLEILSQNKDYDELLPEEKLVLTICYVMNKYKTTQYDPFMMEIRENDYNTNILINGVKISRYDVKGRKYDAVEILAHVVAEISINYMQEADKIYNNGRLQKDLASYVRRSEEKKRIFAQQQLQLPTMHTMTTCLMNLNCPVIYKMIQVANEGESFRLSGADLIVKTSDDSGLRLATIEEIEQMKERAAYVVELLSVVNNATKAVNTLPLVKLSAAADFSSYMVELRKPGVLEYIIDISGAAIEHNKTFKDAGIANYNAEELQAIMAQQKNTSPDVIALLCNSYSTKNKLTKEVERSSAGVLASVYHCYPSTIANEQKLLDSIDRSIVLGKLFKDDNNVISKGM